MSRHTLSVLVEDKPGVLARVASLFSRRSFNIESLAVGPTELPDVSRMTIVVSVDDLPLEQVTKQLNKLINVLKIVELDDETSVQRELLLVKVRADQETRSQVLELVQMFRAKVVDVSSDAMVIEATGAADKLAALLRVLEFLQNEHAGAFSDDEAVAILVPGARCGGRPVVEPGGQCARRREPGHAQAADRRFGAARDHHVRIAERDQPRRIADRVGAR
mgnify:CR=1 FL=1